MGGGAVSPMATFLENVGTVLTSVVSWFGSVSTALISNEVFQVILGILIFIALATYLVNLTGKIRARQRQAK